MSVLFLGLELSETIKADLASYLPTQSKHLRLVKPALFHITLHYLGEIERERVLHVLQQCNQSLVCEPFELTISSLGYFGKKQKPSVLWAGLDPCDALSNLHQALIPVMAACELEVDSRPYHPHITLARGRWRSKPLKEDQDILDTFYRQSFQPIQYRVNSFVLFESKVTEQGRSYPVIQRFNLKKCRLSES